MKANNLAVKNDARAISAGNFRISVLLMGLKVVMYSGVMAGIVLIIFLDAQQPNSIKFSETSYTEYAQEFSLLLTTILFFLCGRLFPNQAVVGYLFGGFFGMAYIREFNTFLDTNVADGTWQALAYSLAALTVFLVYRRRKFFWQQLALFIESMPFGIVILGMLVVFIFSRLYGLHIIWQMTLEENYKYVITRASEESIELLGYAIILIGALEYAFYLKSSRNKRIQNNEVKDGSAELPAYNAPLEMKSQKM